MPSHQYSVSTIHAWILLVTSASASLRSASRIMDVLQNYFNLPMLNTPSWHTGRLWLMRLGHYKLTSEKERADDWIWIVDHSIQLGDDKCLVILGIRICDLPEERALNYEDVEAIDLVPVKKSNGEIVYQQLEETTSKTGIPRAIVGDYGSDIKSGIEKFCEAHDETVYIYDVKHKMASLLKRDLSGEERWESFTTLATKAKQQIQQTGLAGLAPPNQRTKARYMNTEYLLEWGQNMLRLLYQPDDIIKQKGFDVGKLKEKLGWLDDYKNDIEYWNAMLTMATLTENYVRKKGFYNGLDEVLSNKLDKQLKISNIALNQFRKDILKYVRHESSKARPNERLLGSSEIIESLFGKQKFIEKEQSKSGFTGLLLALPALVSKKTDDVIRKAMESTPVKKVHEWYRENIKISVQSSRKKAFEFTKDEEQKLDQLIATA